MCTPHFAEKFDGFLTTQDIQLNVDAEIVMNHYHTKSLEEYKIKINRGRACSVFKRTLEEFQANDKNDVFDDSILKYRDARLTTIGGGANILSQHSKFEFGKLLNALASNLLPGFGVEDTKTFLADAENRAEYFAAFMEFMNSAPKNFFNGKLETYLVCLDLSSRLKKNYLDDELGCLFEEASLYAVAAYLENITNYLLGDIQMLVNYMPKILNYNYHLVELIRRQLIELIETLEQQMYDGIMSKPVPDNTHLNNLVEVYKWREIRYFLQTFDNYNHK